MKSPEKDRNKDFAVASLACGIVLYFAAAGFDQLLPVIEDAFPWNPLFGVFFLVGGVLSPMVRRVARRAKE